MSHNTSLPTMAPGNTGLEQPSSKTQPQLTRTTSETTLVNPKQKMSSHKEDGNDEEPSTYSLNLTPLFTKAHYHVHYCSKTRVTNTEMVTHLDSDSESIMMLKDNSPESTSSPISKTMSKVKSKLKGNPRTEKKNTIYTPSALSTWQALAGELLLDIALLGGIRLTESAEMK